MYSYRLKGEKMKIYNSIDELIGKTPMLRLPGTDIYAKLEYFNPAGSAKDRVALSIINEAERSGRLKKGGTIIEPTSGNTGIGLCAVGVRRGYKVVIVMPDTMSKERQKLIAAYGATLVLTDGSRGMTGAIDKAVEIQKATDNSVIAGQFENEANPEAHYESTGVEIYEDMDGKVDILVSGVGTGGTLTGTGRYLREKLPDVKIVAVEPNDSPLLSKGKAAAHGLQGIGANFVPRVLCRELIDEVICVKTEEAYSECRALANGEGILVGISSGAALFAAKELASRPENRGKNIVVILPDGGERYLSGDVFC